MNQKMTEGKPGQSIFTENGTRRLKAGDRIERLLLPTIQGATVRIPDGEHVVHLQFRRYAGCPVCNLHMRSFVGRYDEIIGSGIKEVVVFYSRAETMLEFQGQLPFAAIADPNKKVYARFGASRRMSLLVALDPRSWFAAINAMVRADTLRGAMGDGEDKRGVPSEFLIGPDGTVLAAKYGERVNDHWSVDQVLDLARQVS